MVEIMLQIAITLYVDDTDVEFVNGCGLPYSAQGGSISSPPSLILTFCYEAVKPQ